MLFEMPGCFNKRTIFVLCLSGLAGLFSCRGKNIDMHGRPCDHGACTKDYICHPETNFCVPIIPVGCNTSGTICPSQTNTGDTCSAVGAFLPCSTQVADCSLGCRTCQPDFQWSACTPGNCTLNTLETCGSCRENCVEQVQNATPLCTTSTTPSSCAYAGSCSPGSFDADTDPQNGCECVPSNGGIEICDAIDNNCNGTVDDGNLCPAGKFCNGTTCVNCPNDDDNHCGPTCSQCQGGTPDCVGGACVCTATSCPNGTYCSAFGTCTLCGNNDPDHCGSSCEQCNNIYPTCENGTCVCTDSSCGAGAFCNGAGTCEICATDPLHCTSSCIACSGTTPGCDGSGCICTSAPSDSCNPASGYYCNSATGNCAACGNDVQHCGPTCEVCSDATPDCNAASGCMCNASSCGPNSVCGLDGNCYACDCPTNFPLCVPDVAGFSCRCNASSCDPGWTCETTNVANDTCHIVDSLNSSPNYFVLCSGNSNSTWQWGSNGLGCNGGSCWGTRQGGGYNSCEKSCITSPLTKLNKVRGTVNLSFWTRYSFFVFIDGSSNEFPEDGATVLLRDNSNVLSVAPPPTGGWDTSNITLTKSGGGCQPFPSWPGFENDNFTWQQKTFSISSGSNSTYFHDNFQWRINAISDNGFQDQGVYIDDIDVSVIFQ